MRVTSSATVVIALALGGKYQPSVAFSGVWGTQRSRIALSVMNDKIDIDSLQNEQGNTRREVLKKASLATGMLLSSFLTPESSQAAVGTLPEFSNTNAILQGLTINVADQSQEDAMIAFLRDAFDFEVLRQRKGGPVTETVRSHFLLY